MSPRVLFLAPQPYFRLRGICIAEQICLEVLSAQGLEVDVLTFPFGEDPAPLPGVRILRLPPLPGVNDIPIGPSVRKVLMDLWSLPWIAVRLMLGGYRFVHACEESAFLAVLFKPLFRFRLIYDMDDVLSLRLARSGFMRSRFLLRRVAALERWMFRTVDVVVTNSRETTRFARKCAAAERVVFYDHAPSLPSALGDHRSGPQECARLRRSWDLEGRKVILYAGNLEPYQGVELLMDALPAVFQRLPGACCVVIGGQAEQIAVLKERCRALGIGPAVRWLGPRPFPDTFLFMQAADVLVSPMTQKKAVPMKLYAYVGSGTPIVATDLPNHRELLDEGSAVLVAPQSGPLAEGLLSVLRGGFSGRPRTDAGLKERVVTSAFDSARAGLRAAYAAAVAAWI
ncbi:MAG: glycosyltransferase [Elusimicrobia bacterium]|nr:glycosyltransferase [Elusimicrobiota bacterium]